MVGLRKAEVEPGDVSGSASTSNALQVAVVAAKSAATRLARSLKAEGFRVLAVTGAVANLEPSSIAATAAVVIHAPEQAQDITTQVRNLRELAPSVRVVVVTPHVNLRALRALLDEGVDALVLDGDASQSLGPAVRSACAGLLAIPRSLRQTLVGPVLSTREKQVLGLVVLGLTNAEIARKLHLAESTVKSHLSSSFSKLGARSRSEATALILDPATGLGTGILTIVDGR